MVLRIRGAGSRPEVVALQSANHADTAGSASTPGSASRPHTRHRTKAYVRETDQSVVTRGRAARRPPCAQARSRAHMERAVDSIALCRRARRLWSDRCRSAPPKPADSQEQLGKWRSTMAPGHDSMGACMGGGPLSTCVHPIVLERAVCRNLRGMAPGGWTWCCMAVFTVTVTVIQFMQLHRTDRQRPGPSLLPATNIQYRTVEQRKEYAKYGKTPCVRGVVLKLDHRQGRLQRLRRLRHSRLRDSCALSERLRRLTECRLDCSETW